MRAPKTAVGDVLGNKWTASKFLKAVGAHRELRRQRVGIITRRNKDIPGIELGWRPVVGAYAWASLGTTLAAVGLARLINRYPDDLFPAIRTAWTLIHHYTAVYKPLN